MKSIRLSVGAYVTGLFLGAFCFATLQAQPPAAKPNAAPPAAAPKKYPTLPLADSLKKPEDRKEPEKKKTDAIKQSYDDAAVRGFYTGWIIPAMTYAAEANINEYRDAFNNDNFLCTSAGRPLFTKMVFDELKPKIEQGGFHPATITNWIFMIGELDSSGERGRNRVPYVESSKALMAWAFDAAQPDYVRIASLAALERHLAGWQDAAKAQMAEKLLTMLEEPKPVARTSSVHGFICRKCLDLLERCNAVLNPRVNQFVLAQVQDVSADTNLRLHCIDLLGSKEFSKSIPPETADILMQQTCKITLERLKYWNYQTDRISQIASSITSGIGGGGGRANMPGMGGGPGMGSGGGEADESSGAGGGAPPGGSPYNPGGGAPGGTTGRKPSGPTQPPEVRIVRRYVYEVLDHVRMGLSGTRKHGELDERNGILPLLEQHDNGPLAQKVLDELTNLQEALRSPTIKDIRGMKMEIEIVMTDLKTALQEYPGVASQEEIEADKAEEAAAEDSTPPAEGDNTGDNTGDKAGQGEEGKSGDDASGGQTGGTDRGTGDSDPGAGPTDPGTGAGAPGPGDPGGGDPGNGGN
jgi:hypothetical protein